MKMKAAILHGPKDLRIEEIEAPAVGDNGVLIKIKVCGICPTDVRYYTGDKRNATYPWRPGHEWVGEVLEVGPRVKRFQPGDRVAAFWQVVCGMCRNCQRGLFNLCLTRWGPDGDERVPSIERGAFAELGWAVPEALERIPDSLSWDEASFTEPLSCCYNGIKRTPISTGDTVAIVGVGPIGQLLAQLARLRGARVIALDLDPGRLALARQLGASDTVVASDSNAVDQVLDLTGGHGADAAIVAVGSPQAEKTALEMVCQGGCVNFFAGTYPSTTIPVDPNLIHYKQLWVTGSFHYGPADFRTAIDLLSREQVQVTPLISHRLPLDEIVEGFEIVANRRGRKVLIHCDGEL